MYIRENRTLRHEGHSIKVQECLKRVGIQCFWHIFFSRFEAEKGAEQAKAAAAATDRKAAKEAVEKVAREDSARATTAELVAPKEATECQTGASSGTLNNQSNESGSDGVKKIQKAGIFFLAKCLSFWPYSCPCSQTQM